MPEENIYLISLETGGNQAYIFSTNKLRNVVGASELIYRTGTEYVERAVREATCRVFSVEKIVDEQPIETTQGKYIEVVVATSGKAVLLARGEELAKKFITEWSKILVKEAPGVDALAVYSKTPVDLSLAMDENIEGSLAGALEEVRRQYERAKMKNASSVSRFQRIPVVAECTYSGLPAAGIEIMRDGDENQNSYPVSSPAKAQREASLDEKLKKRMKDLYPKGLDKIITDNNGLESLEGMDWLAVVHADGNGLGQLFINFKGWVKNWVKKLKGVSATGRDYVDCYRNFSAALDEISQNTFKETVTKIWRTSDANIVPIVVGGDDLTAVMEGRKALKFTEEYMKAFCSATKEHDAIKAILGVTEDPRLSRLGMCAGIAITKAHFPFSQSYHLAEELIRNAKEVKKQFGTDSIALDFHVVYDSVGSAIKTIREKLMIGEVCLTAKPYVIEKGAGVKDGKESNEEWRKIHCFSQFIKAVQALASKGDDKNLPLPPSQAHLVRESLFNEQGDTQEAEWNFLLTTYGGFAAKWREAFEDGKLYIKVNMPSPRYYTYFLDALEAVKFMEGGE